MHDICYVDRFKFYHLELLELRHMHVDLIMLCKIFNGSVYM